MADNTTTNEPVENRVDFYDNGKPNQDYYIYGIRLKKYRSPTAQVLIVSFFAFATVGMSSALGGAGGGGLLNTTQSNNANVATYSSNSGISFVKQSLYTSNKG